MSYAILGDQFRMRKLVFLLALMLPLEAAAQENRLKPVRFQYEGERRMYLSYAPKAASRSSDLRPLILVLHGGGGTARQISRGTFRRFDLLADKYGFFVAYPNAIGKMWDTGGGKVSESLSPRRNDLGFLEHVIDRMAAQYPIDKSRVFATGISRGGHASFMLACRSKKVRAIAPVAMNLPKQLTADCQGGKPRGLLLINGTEDPLVPFNGGQVRVLRKLRDHVESADHTLSIFGRRNGCGGVSKKQRIDVENDGTKVEYRAWRCSNASVANFKVIGGGHTWPSEKNVLPERVVGRVSRDIVATDHIVTFFLGLR